MSIDLHSYKTYSDPVYFRFYFNMLQTGHVSLEANGSANMQRLEQIKTSIRCEQRIWIYVNVFLRIFFIFYTHTKKIHFCVRSHFKVTTQFFHSLYKHLRVSLTNQLSWFFKDFSWEGENIFLKNWLNRNDIMLWIK